jgi:hypothetical protein
LLKNYTESPRWLMKKNKYKEALTALIVFHGLPSPIVACGELYLIFRRLEAEERAFADELNNPPRDNEYILQGLNVTSEHETRNRQPAEMTENSISTVDHVQLHLEDTSWVKRIRLLWKVKRIRQ